MDEEIEETISHDDDTPSILQQAEKEGWKAGYYNFGKAEGDNRDWFNPSIVERDDGLWLLVRGSEPHQQGFPFGQNFIWAFELDATGKIPKRGIRLRWPVEIPDQHFEDPRGFYHPAIDQTIIGACTFVWYPDRSWTGAHQCIGSFDSNWQCSKMDYPKIGGSPGMLEMITDKKKYEKNWLPFLHDNHLHILYKAKPWQIVGYGLTWSDLKSYQSEGVSWAYGDIRGGTSPVKVGDYYFTFPHSSLMWRGRYRRYYAGAMAFDANPPFTPRMITPEPILRGSQNDVWAQKKPLVIFPCGALYRNGTWLITAGINDIKAGWVEIPHEDILKRMVSIDKSGGSVFPANGLTPSEIEARKKALSGGSCMKHTEVQALGTDCVMEPPSQKLLSSVPVLAERSAQQESRDSEARESTCENEGLSTSTARGGTQKLSGEALKQKQRENAAKARAARAAKREIRRDAGAIVIATKAPHVIQEGESGYDAYDRIMKSKPKRRKRMRKKRTAQEKRDALEQWKTKPIEA